MVIGDSGGWDSGREGFTYRGGGSEAAEMYADRIVGVHTGLSATSISDVSSSWGEGILGQHPSGEEPRDGMSDPPIDEHA